LLLNIYNTLAYYPSVNDFLEVKTLSIQEMLADLIKLGWSQEQIAKEVGVSQPTIHRAVVGGSAISYTTGKKIEALHASVDTSKAA
jgi:predicted transcriptional regulator